MIWAVIISALLIALTVFVQGQAFRLLLRSAPKISGPEDLTLLLVVPAVFVVHLLNAGLYTLVFVLMQDRLGAIAGEAGTSIMDFLYLSLTSYTTVGFGDVYATGPMRIVSATESLNGLLLIGWSATFTFTFDRK